jgi:hypothetical protein
MDVRKNRFCRRVKESRMQFQMREVSRKQKLAMLLQNATALYIITFAMSSER